MLDEMRDAIADLRHEMNRIQERGVGGTGRRNVLGSGKKASSALATALQGAVVLTTRTTSRAAGRQRTGLRLSSGREEVHGRGKRAGQDRRPLVQICTRMLLSILLANPFCLARRTSSCAERKRIAIAVEISDG